MAAQAVYDWAAQSEAELSLSVGETVTLADGGESYSEGWYEVEKDGRKGIVPSAYVQLV